MRTNRPESPSAGVASRVKFSPCFRAASSMRERMCPTISSPRAWDAPLSPWCFPVRALRHSASPMNPRESDPCRSTGRTASFQPSFSESIQIPCPIRKGKFLTFLRD